MQDLCQRWKSPPLQKKQCISDFQNLKILHWLVKTYRVAPAIIVCAALTGSVFSAALMVKAMSTLISYSCATAGTATQHNGTRATHKRND